MASIIGLFRLFCLFGIGRRRGKVKEKIAGTVG
ncbi:hypothetical protein L905_06635 [Agrobacterium sp. TS43]|nr:hypothetical protein L904_22420 [Agrobacterium sp. LY4]KVK48411.1 hypothetical protein L903_22005 [Agrobacterium sp. JL28]KVK61364.1 hypothetical protein L906_21120 [Agrobacterium sp. TS45]KVK61654.1 hypothetical protein L905_06635 [Agrobacterium sp. TS43]KVK66504.1 hypothetical protein L907_21085 [Agrobacterium sp. C13]